MMKRRRNADKGGYRRLLTYALESAGTEGEEELMLNACFLEWGEWMS